MHQYAGRSTTNIGKARGKNIYVVTSENAGTYQNTQPCRRKEARKRSDLINILVCGADGRVCRCGSETKRKLRIDMNQEKTTERNGGGTGDGGGRTKP